MAITEKLIISYFADGSGNPLTGLTPTVDIWEITSSTDTLVVNDASATEIGGGFYKYNFTSYDYTLRYAIKVDGGEQLSAGRFAITINDIANMSNGSKKNFL